MNCMRRRNHCSLNVLLLVLGIVCISECVASSAVHDVFNFIFSNTSYNKDIRPVKQWKTPTVVDVTVSIIAIVDYNEVQQMIKLATKLILNWKDEYLVWDPTLYENVSHIHAPQSKIWMPAIILENSVAKHLEFGTSSLKVTINHDGTVQWEPIEVFQSTCAADVRKFPFDTQTCEIVFESMIYSADEVILHSTRDYIDFHLYGGISGWTATDTDVEVEVGAGNRKTHLICSLTMRRHPAYFILNIYIPIILLTFMNICVFILPVQSGEKASFVITVFLSLAVFLTIVSSKLPENSDTVSLLNVYVFISTLLSVIIAISTIIQIRIYHKDNDTPVPNFLKRIVARFTSNPNPSCSSDKNTNPNDDVQKKADVNALPTHTGKEPIGELMNDKHKEGHLVITWSDVVMALDNVFFYLFLTINISMTVAIFVLAIQQDDHEELEMEHHHH